MFKHLAAALLTACALAAFAAPASAATPVPWVVRTLPDWNACLITGTTATVCTAPHSAGAATYLIGLANNSTSSQTANVTCYDNASTATGTIAFTFAPPGPGQILTFPPPGLQLANGMTCQASAAITGTSVIIMVR